MSRTGGTTWPIVAGVLATAGAGYVAGTFLPGGDCSRSAGVICLAGLALALIALFRRQWDAAGRRVERVAAGGLLAYVLIATLTEQFAWVFDAEGVVVAGGVVLPRRGCWFAGLGCWAVLFAATAAVAYSATHTGSGMGLFIRWME